MSWDHYFIGNGAQHSAEIMRLLPYMMLGAQEGVLSHTDCLVTELDTPGAAVYVNPGVVSIQNRAPGYNYDTYLGRLTSRDRVAITPTDSSGPRSDLIVVRSEDPLSGTSWSPPSDPRTGPYLYSRVIEGVDPATTSYQDTGGGDSAVALARIDIPASTATITQDMIVDLRQVVNPVTGFGGKYEKNWTGTVAGPAQAESIRAQTAGGVVFQAFPSTAVWSVPIPPWATEVTVLAMSNPYMVNSAWGFARVTLGSLATSSTWVDDNYYEGGQGGQRTQVMAADTLQIPASMRGQTVQAQFQMRVSEQSQVSEFRADAGTRVHLQLDFKQTPTAS